ncbi:MAG: accessory gene regulator B family protein [Clostridiales bacterium]|nr:accessory gene regulator B family protein [Clostridiales bacterium]
MEYLSSCVTDRMIALDIIGSDDRDCYCYSLQGLFEKTICLSLIILLAAVFRSLVGVLAFLSIFMLIRRSSDGIHCNTTAGCFSASLLMSLSTIGVVKIISRHCAACLGGGGNCNGDIVQNSDIQQPRFEFNRKGTEPP